MSLEERLNESIKRGELTDEEARQIWFEQETEGGYED